MKCPQCSARSDVLEKRERRFHVTRRRLCMECGFKFTTKETVFDTKRKPIGGSSKQLEMARQAIRARGQS